MRRASAVAQLEIENRSRQQQRRSVRRDQRYVTQEEAIHQRPEYSGREDKEHGKREILGRSRAPGAKDLRQEGDGGAKRRRKSDEMSKHSIARARCDAALMTRARSKVTLPALRCLPVPRSANAPAARYPDSRARRASRRHR